jgi:GNAT superfamily N-acetyltransferase
LNSALPVDTAGTPDPAVVEHFYARLGIRALVQMAPAEALVGLDSELARRGWCAEGAAAHARRRGVAGAVMHALTRWATERGAQRMYVLVERDNVPAHALYARTGFTRSHGYHYRAAPA